MAWLIGNDLVLDVTGLSDPVTGSYLNSATVTAVMKDAAGAELAGQTWPLTLGYVADSDGHYQGVLEDGLEMSEFGRYWIEITVDSGGDLIGFWRWSDVANYRGPGS